MKNVIRDVMLQRLKNEAEFCPDSKDNPRCLMEDEQNSTKYFYRCDLHSDGIFVWGDYGSQNNATPYYSYMVMIQTLFSHRILTRNPIISTPLSQQKSYTPDRKRKGGIGYG